MNSIISHDKQHKEDDTEQLPTVIIHRCDDYCYGSYLHFVRDGLAPWLKTRSLFPNCRKTNHIGSYEYPNEISTPSSSIPSLFMFQEYPHVTNACFDNCSGSFFLIYVLSMALIFMEVPLDEASNIWIGGNNYSLFNKKYSFSNPCIQKFLTSWIKLQLQIPYTMKEELLHIMSEYLKTPPFMKMTLQPAADTAMAPNTTVTKNDFSIQIHEVLDFLRLALLSIKRNAMSNNQSSLAHQVIFNLCMSFTSPLEYTDILRSYQFTDAENQLHVDTLDGGGDPDQKLVSFEYMNSGFYISVTRHSLKRLRPMTYLNDEVINYIFMTLAHREETFTIPSSSSRYYYFKSHFVSRLLDEGKTDAYNYDNVKNWSKRMPGRNIFLFEKVFIAIHLKLQNHWALALIMIEEKRIHYLDPMGLDGTRYVNAIIQYLHDESKQNSFGDESFNVSEWEAVHSDIRKSCRQRNGFDCGVFVCIYAELLSMGFPISSLDIINQDIINFCRKHIVMLILQGYGFTRKDITISQAST